jgi:hypothetical protein
MSGALAGNGVLLFPHPDSHSVINKAQLYSGFIISILSHPSKPRAAAEQYY